MAKNQDRVSGKAGPYQTNDIFDNPYTGRKNGLGSSAKNTSPKTAASEDEQVTTPITHNANDPAVGKHTNMSK